MEKKIVVLGQASKVLWSFLVQMGVIFIYLDPVEASAGLMAFSMIIILSAVFDFGHLNAGLLFGMDVGRAKVHVFFLCALLVIAYLALHYAVDSLSIIYFLGLCGAGIGRAVAGWIGVYLRNRGAYILESFGYCMALLFAILLSASLWFGILDIGSYIFVLLCVGVSVIAMIFSVSILLFITIKRTPSKCAHRLMESERRFHWLTYILTVATANFDVLIIAFFGGDAVLSDYRAVILFAGIFMMPLELLANYYYGKSGKNYHTVYEGLSRTVVNYQIAFIFIIFPLLVLLIWFFYKGGGVFYALVFLGCAIRMSSFRLAALLSMAGKQRIRLKVSIISVMLYWGMLALASLHGSLDALFLSYLLAMVFQFIMFRGTSADVLSKSKVHV